MMKKNMTKPSLFLLSTLSLCVANAWAQDQTNTITEDLTSTEALNIHIENFGALFAMQKDVTVQAPSIAITNKPDQQSPQSQQSPSIATTAPGRTVNIVATEGSMVGKFTGNDQPTFYLLPGSSIKLKAKDKIELTRDGNPHAIVAFIPDRNNPTGAQLTMEADSIVLKGNSQLLSNKFGARKWASAANAKVEILAKNGNSFSTNMSQDNLGMIELNYASQNNKIVTEAGDNVFALESSEQTHTLLGVGYDTKLVVEATKGNNIFKANTSKADALLKGVQSNKGDLLLKGVENKFSIPKGVAVIGQSSGKVTLSAEKQNFIEGYLEGSITDAISSSDFDATIVAKYKSEVSIEAGERNTIRSVIDGANGIKALNEETRVTVSAPFNEITAAKHAVLVEDEALVELKGESTLASTTDAAVKAIKTGTASINGLKKIEGKDVAISSGVIKGRVDEEFIQVYGDTTKEQVIDELKQNEHYSNQEIRFRDDGSGGELGYFVYSTSLDDLLKKEQSKVSVQYIDGATVKGRLAVDGGTIDFTPASDKATLTHTVEKGPMFVAQNKGTLNYTLAKGASIEGFAYNFLDLGAVTQDAKESTKQEGFMQKADLAGTKAVAKTPDYVTPGEFVPGKDGKLPDMQPVGFAPGFINLTLQDGASWTMTQQSAITKLGGSGVVEVSKDKPGQALHIAELAGNNTFKMHLEKEDKAADSDILYIGKGAGTQKLEVTNGEALFKSMKKGDFVRVATIKESSSNEFGQNKGTVYESGEGLLRTKVVGVYSKNGSLVAKDKDEAYNQAYNGKEWSDKKPGQDFVTNFYGKPDDLTHYYLMVDEPIVSDAGLVLPTMQEAVYGLLTSMDTLNKRQGEIRRENLNQGPWVRVTYDKLKKKGDFDLSGTAFEMGYDISGYKMGGVTQGASHGLFIHYGKYDPKLMGVNDRFSKMNVLALGAHSTYRFNCNGYLDVVGRIGRLNSEYTVGDNATHGKYHNTFVQLSAEVGHSFKLNPAWSVEPQAQLQYTHVRHVHYKDSENIDVNLGAINSVIGRLGARVTRNMSEVRDEVGYVYANMEHEFNGRVKVAAHDVTGAYADTHHNRTTWFNVGLGYSLPVAKTFFVAGQAEKRFGSGYKGLRFDVSAKYLF